MAEDRMLSDEVLLALIKKNSGGGGGGGTDDYNDLKNQPKINNNTLVGNKTASDLGLVAAEAGKDLSSNNYTDEDKAIVGGVTAALADKADKSAVKNEFLGTLDEWNALTEEQRKAYDTYQITDDYTEGKYIYLPTIYSEEERQVGVWADGKPLYQKTWKLSSTITINISGVTLPSQIDNDLAVAENIINASAVRLKVDNGSVACIPLCVWKAGTSYSALCSDDWSDVRDITIQYTKTTDTAGSGTWTPTGEYAHHYSTDEQIVGTWIDGKTLYRRVIVNVANETIVATNVDTIVNVIISRHGASTDNKRHVFGDGFTINDGGSVYLDTTTHNAQYAVWASTGGSLDKSADHIIIEYTKTA